MVLVLQLVVTTLLLSHPNINRPQTRILGVQLAQETAPTDLPITPADTTPPAPTDNPTLPSTSPPAATPGPTDNHTASPLDQPPSDQTTPAQPGSDQSSTGTNPTAPTSAGSSSSTPAPSVPADLNDQMLETPGPTTSSSLIPSANTLPEPLATQPPLETTTDSSGVVLNPNETALNPDNINEKVIKDAQTQDKELEQATTPREQAQISLNNAVQQVLTIDQGVKKDNFADVSFVSQRLSNQIDETLKDAAKLPPAQAAVVRDSLSGFCTQANTALRTLQLSVPEDSVQDLEISRAKCQEATSP